MAIGIRIRNALAVSMIFAFAPLVALAQNEGNGSANLQMVVNADLGTATISRHIYGHFAEHLGRGIYDGFWTKAETGEWHFRDDLIEAMRKIQVPNVRWPGGCFADYYHWKDGIGENRPTMINTLWGGVTEDNSFGTHEYMELMARLGAEPFVVGNVGSGSVREMSEWWEYFNFPGVSPMADMRRANGREEPWGVRFWGVGNESWGCGGAMAPEYYANEYKRYAEFLRPYGGTRPFRVATGAYGDNYEWTEVMMREAGSMIDGIDLHYYTLAGTWSDKGSATEFDEDRWFKLMKNQVALEEIIERQSTIMDRYDPDKRVALIVGEWGTWYNVEEGTNPGFLYQQNSLRDAVVAAAELDLFNNHADRVRGANIAQTINVLQAMILTDGAKMLLTPTYHVFEFYTVHHDATLVPITLEKGTYEFEGDAVPAISASASRDSLGVVHITMTNRDPNKSRTIAAQVRGTKARKVSGRVLTASTMNAHNTFERPNVVQPAAFRGASFKDGTLTVEMPPKAVVVLTLE